MNTYFFQEQEAQLRQQELLSAAKRERLARLAMAGQPSTLDRASTSFGAVLVSLGQRLQRRMADDKRSKATSFRHV